MKIWHGPTFREVPIGLAIVVSTPWWFGLFRICELIYGAFN